MFCSFSLQAMHKYGLTYFIKIVLYFCPSLSITYLKLMDFLKPKTRV